MVYYAQINSENVCVGICSLKGEVNVSDMVRIQEYSEDYIYRKYEDGQWSEEKFMPDYGQIELDRMDAVEQAIAELSILIAGGGE